MDKAEIINDIKSFMTGDLHVDPVRGHIQVDLDGDAILLEGTVDDIRIKKRVLLHSMSLPGVRGTIDRLRVSPSKEMGDKEIRKHLLDALTEEPSLDASSIIVEVGDGVVDLEGVVPSLTHKRLAGVLAWWVPGSVEVINSLDVQPPQDDTDEELMDAVKLVLEKDSLVDASSISVSVKDWEVTLTGTVRDDIEKRASESDTWYVWGVNGVINGIEVLR